MFMELKKRYCIFAAQYFPHLGGVERYTYNLARKLIEEGNEVIIVTSNVYRIKAYERVDGIPVYRLPCIANANFSRPCKYSSFPTKSLFLLFATQDTAEIEEESMVESNSFIRLFFKFSIFVPGNCPFIALTSVEYEVCVLFSSDKERIPK